VLIASQIKAIEGRLLHLGGSRPGYEQREDKQEHGKTAMLHHERILSARQ